MFKILIVDEDEESLKAVEKILTTHGYDVMTHSIRTEVDEIVSYYKPNLIILDIVLLKKSKADLFNFLKNNFSIPIFLFTADIARARAAAEYKADDFVQKPVIVNDLLDAIKKILK